MKGAPCYNAFTSGEAWCKRNSSLPRDLSLWRWSLRQLNVHPHAVPRDARSHGQNLTRRIHNGSFRDRVVRFQILGEGYIYLGFDDPVERPLVVLGEEYDRQHELPGANAQPDSFVLCVRGIDVSSRIGTVRRERSDFE